MNRNALEKAITAAGGRKALAESLGVSESAINKWAIGERLPRPDRILMIEAMFGIPREHLMPTLFRRVVGLDHAAHEEKNSSCPIDY